MESKLIKQHFKETRSTTGTNPRVEKFVKSLENKRHAKLIEMSKFV